MKLVLIGIPGAGKSTQGNLLSKQLNIPYLSTGHIFRTLAKEKTKLGRYIKETINAGLLIPDKKVLEIVSEYLSRPEYKRGYILDGFPRTVAQAKNFKDKIDKVFYIKVPDKEALWRLAYRNNSLRGDDTVAAVAKRIDIFHKVTEPVIDFYRKTGLLAEVDGMKSIEEVNKEILKHLGKQKWGDSVRSWSQKKKSIIVLTGLPASGKSTAAKYFEKKGLPVIRFGQIINELVDKQGKPHTEEIHKKLRIQMRKKYGMEAMAVLNKDKISQALSESNIVVIEGLRSWEEYEFLKKHFSDVRIFLVHIFADKELRYKRLKQRKYRNKLGGVDRDKSEVFDTNMGPTLALADFVIKNNFSLDDFYSKLEELYRRVYFS